MTGHGQAKCFKTVAAATGNERRPVVVRRHDDVYSPMKAENTQLQETEWTGDRQTYYNYSCEKTT